MDHTGAEEKAVTVYLAPRKKAQPTEEVAEMTPEEIEKKRNEEMGMKVVQAAANLAIAPLCVKIIWNWVVPGVFGIATLTYLEAVGLYCLCKILFTDSRT